MGGPTRRRSAASTSPCAATPSGGRSTPSRRTCTSTRSVAPRCGRSSSGRRGWRSAAPTSRCSRRSSRDRPPDAWWPCARPTTMLTNSAWNRASPVISGWNDVASRCACRTATILPTASPDATVATSWTSWPTFSTQGARMNSAWKGASKPATASSASNESTWRPKALRRTTTSRPPIVSWSAVPPSIRSASRIMPAQVPKAGSPPRSASRSGSNSPNARASLCIVVDSPPGITMPSTCSSSSGRRTFTARAPARSSMARCSRTSPWRARTPIVGPVTGRSACASGRRPRCGPRRTSR